MIEQQKELARNAPLESIRVVAPEEQADVATAIILHKPSIFHKFVVGNYGFGNGMLYAFTLASGVAAILLFLAQKISFLNASERSSNIEFLSIDVASTIIMLPLMVVVALTYLPKVTEAMHGKSNNLGRIAGASRGLGSGCSMAIMASKILGKFFTVIAGESNSIQNSVFFYLFIGFTWLAFVVYHSLSEISLFSRVLATQSEQKKLSARSENIANNAAAPSVANVETTGAGCGAARFFSPPVNEEVGETSGFMQQCQYGSLGQ